MSITTNARNPQHLKAVNKYIQLHKDLLPGLEAHISFDEDDQVNLTEDGSETSFGFDEFQEWLKGGAPRGDDEPVEVAEPEEPAEEAAEPEEEPEEAAEPTGEGVVEHIVETVTEEPLVEEPEDPDDAAEGGFFARTGIRPEDEIEGEDNPVEPVLAEPDFTVSMRDIVTAAYTIHEEERSGELGRNKARYKRGHFLLALDDVYEDLEVDNRKELLEKLNLGMLEMANANNSTDRYKPITESEASMTTKVVEAFAPSAVDETFELVDAIDPTTGQPIMNDAGEPPQLPITEVALNKLYPLVEYADENNRDKLISFAHRYSESVVKRLKSHAKKAEVPMLGLVDHINEMREVRHSPILDADISVQPSEETVLEWIREQRGEEPPSEVVSIKTDRAWYEAVWVPLKAFATHVYESFGLALGDDGMISNVKLLELTVGQFHPAEEGFQKLLLMMVEGEDITEAQARRYYARVEEIDPETGEVTLSEVIDESEAAEVAEEFEVDEELDQEEDEEVFIDDDFDIDIQTPATTSEEEDEDYDDEFDIEEFDEVF